VPRPGSLGDYWVTSDDLDLQGTLAQEWQTYRRAIINNGIKLGPGPDVLKWTGDSSGRITVKNVYEAVEGKKHLLHRRLEKGALAMGLSTKA
jgi:hypothetical protein